MKGKDRGHRDQASTKYAGDKGANGRDGDRNVEGKHRCPQAHSEGTRQVPVRNLQTDCKGPWTL